MVLLAFTGATCAFILRHFVAPEVVLVVESCAAVFIGVTGVDVEHEAFGAVTGVSFVACRLVAFLRVVSGTAGGVQVLVGWSSKIIVVSI